MAITYEVPYIHICKVLFSANAIANKIKHPKLPTSVAHKKIQVPPNQSFIKWAFRHCSLQQQKQHQLDNGNNIFG